MIKYVHPESREKEGLRSMHPADFCAKLVQKSKGKGQAPNGLVHVYASFVALAKIAEQNTALGCFGLEREREREICDLLPSDLHSHKQFPLL